MKFITRLDLGILGAPDSSELWQEILDQIPDSVLLKPHVKILNVACGHGTEAVILAKRMIALGIPKEKVNDSMFLLDKYHTFTNQVRNTYGFKNVFTRDFLEWQTDMKFDVVIGNPPYQDGSKEGGQNKIYNQFAKKALDLLNKDSILAFVTPTSVLKKSKRFSLVGINGLKIVNFTAKDHFDVGVTTCWWLIDKNHTGDVLVKTSNGTFIQSNQTVIYDYSKVDVNFVRLYEGLKEKTSSPELRMFKQNGVATTSASKKKTKIHVYQLYKIESGQLKPTYWVAREPHFYNKKKFSVSVTKSLTEDAVYVGKENFDPGYLTIEVKNTCEIENIKSFILSDYFRKHCDKWKQVDGYGFNNALKYLPPFDTSKSWTNMEVKQFIESVIQKSK